MNAFELFLLGRTLMKIGEESMQRAGYQQVPASVRSIVMDVIEHPDSAVGEIVSRTGFPQSHVSASVSTLRERGTFETRADPADRRRTLVRLSPEFRKRAARAKPAPIEEALADALAATDPGEIAHVTALLKELSLHLSPTMLERIRSKYDVEKAGSPV
jgi:DNA-binding MarR family transcriptional regulator